MRSRLTGRVVELSRGRWLLVANLPPACQPGGRRCYPKRQRRVDAGGVRDAGAQLRRWLDQLEQELTTDPTRLIVASLADRWLDAVRWDLRPKSLASYRGDIDRYVTPILGGRVAAEVEPADLSALYAQLRERGLAESSANHVHRTVRAMYSWAVREGRLPANPARRVKKPPRASHEPHSTWDEATIARAVRLADGLAVHLPLMLAAWAGLRRSEVCGLRWEAVDLERGYLRVVASLEQTGTQLHVEEPKREASVRCVPLPVQLIDVLRERRRLDDAQRLRRRSWNPDGYVVTGRDGGPVKPDMLSRLWSRFVRTRELPIVTFHELRHSYASILIFEQGEQLNVVQELLGHADPATTARIYLHPTEDAHAGALARREARIAAAMAKELQDSQSIRNGPVSLAAARRRKSLQGA